MAYESSDQHIKQSLKIQQETEKAEAFQAGVMNALMMISKAHPPGELPPYVPPDKPSSPWEPGKSPAPSRKMMAHGKHFGDRGEIIPDPTYGIRPDGSPVYLEHMEQTPEEKKRNKELHDWKFHDGSEPELASGPDYIGDKRTYGKLDRILNPLGDFKKPTLDQLRIHAANYPKV